MRKSFSRGAPTYNIYIGGRGATSKRYAKHVRKKHRKHFRPKKSGGLPWNFQKPSYQKGLSWNLQSSMRLPHHQTLYGTSHPALVRAGRKGAVKYRSQQYVKTGIKAYKTASPIIKGGAKAAIGGARWIAGGIGKRLAARRAAQAEKKAHPPGHTGIQEIAATAQKQPGVVYGRKNLP